MLALVVLLGFVADASAKVLILFDEDARHIDFVATTRERVERSGGRVRAVLGVAGILADVPTAGLEELEAMDGVRVYDAAVAVAQSADAETVAVLTAWNRLLAPEPAPSAVPRLLGNDMVEDSTRARARDRFRRAALNAEYRQHAEELRRTMPWRLQRSNGIGCGTNGADYLDTSLFLAGDVAVGVFYVAGTNTWTPATTASSFADVVHALDGYIDIEPRARLTFTYVTEVDGAGNPLPKQTNEYQYVNDLRSTYCSDWAFVIDMYDGGVWPNANLGGPSLRMDWRFGAFHDVLRHEVAHIFGAYDAYPPIGPGGRFGYLLGAHANACGPGGGYFAGAGECLEDLMAGWGPQYGYNSRISPSTAAQLGWIARGDGVLAVLDTKPVIDATTVTRVVNPASSAATYNGTAVDRPVLNESAWGSDASINRITAVMYRIGNTPWQAAVAADGVFDSSSEDFLFTTPRLRNGTYTVEIRAKNTIGELTPVAYSEQLVITASGVTNTRPFGALSVTPSFAKSGTPIKASASAADLEPGSLQFSWNWGTFWTPFSPSSITTHVYNVPGTYLVQMRVRDQGGLIQLLSQQVIISATDTPPVAKLSVTPENQHLTGSSYGVFLTTTGSSDAETPFHQLKVQWDVDCNGWDAPAAIAKSKFVSFANGHSPRSDRRCVRIQVIDAANNATSKTQYVWDVPYNHPPVITSATFAPIGNDFTLTVNASDPDSATSWDGILEYRYDFEGDGIWNTTFAQGGASVLVPGAHRYTVRIEVRDRFYARALWYYSPCAPLAC